MIMATGLLPGQGSQMALARLLTVLPKVSTAVSVDLMHVNVEK